MITNKGHTLEQVTLALAEVELSGFAARLRNGQRVDHRRRKCKGDGLEEKRQGLLVVCESPQDGHILAKECRQRHKRREQHGRERHGQIDGNEGQGVCVLQLPSWDEMRHRGVLRRPPQQRKALDDGRRNQQVDEVGKQRQGEDQHRSPDVCPNHRPLAIPAVGEDAGYGSDNETWKHSGGHDDSDSGVAAQLAGVDGDGYHARPVPETGHELRQEEPKEVAAFEKREIGGPLLSLIRSGQDAKVGALLSLLNARPPGRLPSHVSGATLQMRGGAHNRRQEAALALFVLSFLMYLHWG